MAKVVLLCGSSVVFLDLIRYNNVAILCVSKEDDLDGITYL